MAKRLLLLVLILSLWPATALGQGEELRDTERIESFTSRVSLLPQGDIEVMETIVLVNHGERVSWGIERLLPRWVETGQGREQALAYEILEVLVDGAPAPYGLVDTAKGLAVTVGDPALTLPPGRYVFTLSYRCGPIIEFHAFSQSLTWNATGTWPLPIERATVRVEFARAPRPGFEEWGAVVGVAPGESWSSVLEEENWLRFEATRPLAAGEAMVIRASWPQGYAQAPPFTPLLDLDCRARLGSDRILSVREQVRLRNDGSLGPGFARDFPDLYHRGGRRRISALEITRVQVDGEDFPWLLTAIPGGQRLQVGGPDNPLPPGEFLLTIDYTLDRQVEAMGELEELDWQLPGFPWSQAIGQARFTLELPAELVEVQPLRTAFTRKGGAAGSDVFHYEDGYGRLVFASAGPLDPGESMQISAAWPAGLLPPVPLTDQALWLFRDNAAGAATLLVFGLFLVGVAFAAFRQQRTPRVAASAPPAKCSPALLRYLRLGTYDNRAFTVAVLSLAVKGNLMIVEEGGNYALVNSGIRSYLPPDEEVLAQVLFAKKMAVFPAKDRSLLREARRAHGRSVSGQARDLLRRKRGIAFALAVLGVLAAMGSGWLLPASLGVRIGLVGFELWAAVLAGVALRTGTLFPALVDEWGGKAVALVLVLELAIAGAITYLWGDWLAVSYDWPAILAILGIIALSVALFRVLPAPTSRGRELLAQARGFREWLLEKERPGGPSQFEKYLPYAVALDAATRWGRRFGMPKRKDSFAPRWYQGSRWHTINAETLAASLSLLEAGVRNQGGEAAK